MVSTLMKTPLDVTLLLFTSQSDLARHLGVTQGLVSKWKHKFGGKVPQKYMITLIEEAKRRGKKLTARDLIYGR